MANEGGVAQSNKEQIDRAMGLLYEASQQTLTSISRGKKITQIQIRVPVHGNKFGVPKLSVESE